MAILTKVPAAWKDSVGHELQLLGVLRDHGIPARFDERGRVVVFDGVLVSELESAEIAAYTWFDEVHEEKEEEHGEDS